MGLLNFSPANPNPAILESLFFRHSATRTKVVVIVTVGAQIQVYPCLEKGTLVKFLVGGCWQKGCPAELRGLGELRVDVFF